MGLNVKRKGGQHRPVSGYSMARTYPCLQLFTFNLQLHIGTCSISSYYWNMFDILVLRDTGAAMTYTLGREYTTYGHPEGKEQFHLSAQVPITLDKAIGSCYKGPLLRL